jgi:hypothetical protein
MARFKPLFPQESMRTRQFRKVIIRKTLQIARQHPTWTDEEIAALVETEVPLLCDLCVESSFNKTPVPSLEKFFLNDDRDQRQDYVGRFFVHRMEKKLRSNNLTNNIITIFYSSVVSLQGHHAHEDYTKRQKELIDHMMLKGLRFDEIIESDSAKNITQEIIDVYRYELVKTASFETLLKNKLDAELARYQLDNQDEHIDIIETVNRIYDEFLETIGVPSSRNKSGYA